MDDHTDAQGSPEEPSRPLLNLFGPPVCILVAGLVITAVADHQATTMVWAYGSLISGFGALVCALVTIRWHRHTRDSAAIRQELRDQSLQLNNMQTEKRILRQALDDSEQRSRDLVSLSGAIVCELDEQGKTGYISGGVNDILGFAPADMAGVAIHSLISDADRKAFQTTLTAARQGRSLQCIELALVGADGQPVPITLRVLALHDTLHGFCGFRMSMQPGHSAH